MKGNNAEGVSQSNVATLRELLQSFSPFERFNPRVKKPWAATDQRLRRNMVLMFLHLFDSYWVDISRTQLNTRKGDHAEDSKFEIRNS